MREYEIIINALCSKIVTLESSNREIKERAPLNINTTAELDGIAEQYGNYCYRCGKAAGAYYNFQEWRRRVVGGENL